MRVQKHQFRCTAIYMKYILEYLQPDNTIKFITPRCNWMMRSLKYLFDNGYLKFNENVNEENEFYKLEEIIELLADDRVTEIELIRASNLPDMKNIVMTPDECLDAFLYKLEDKLGECKYEKMINYARTRLLLDMSITMVKEVTKLYSESSNNNISQ